MYYLQYILAVKQIVRHVQLQDIMCSLPWNLVDTIILQKYRGKYYNYYFYECPTQLYSQYYLAPERSAPALYPPFPFQVSFFP